MTTKVKTDSKMVRRGEAAPWGTRLPVRPKPLEDEVFSSWWTRVARGNGLSLRKLTGLLFEQELSFSRDIDRNAPDWVIDGLSRATDVPAPTIRAMTLAAFEGLLRPNTVKMLSHLRWILPVGAAHRSVPRYGLQYCPACFESDAIPYHRLHWRLAFVSVCPVHGLMMQNKCQVCGAGISIVRRDLSGDLTEPEFPLSACWSCRKDLHCFPRSANQAPLETAMEFQRHLWQGVERGWFDVPGYGEVYSFLYLDGIYQLLKLLSVDPPTAPLRYLVQTAMGFETGDERATGKLHLFENLSPDARHRVLAMVAWLLENWPERFVDACTTAGLHESHVLRDMRRPPYWFAEVVTSRLRRYEKFNHKHRGWEVNGQPSARKPAKSSLDHEPKTMFEYLKSIPDPRRGMSCVYRLEFVLAVAIIAMALGETHCEGVYRFAERHANALEILGGRFGPGVNGGLFRRIFAEVDVEFLEQRIMGWTKLCADKLGVKLNDLEPFNMKPSGSKRGVPPMRLAFVSRFRTHFQQLLEFVNLVSERERLDVIVNLLRCG
jgi:TniQ/DDE_Tnp_1-associated